MTTRFPIIFTFSQPVNGNGYAAIVRARGRFVASQDEAEGWWIYGVTPGGLAEGGTKNRSEAQEAFRNAWAEVLFEIAEEAKDFDAFKAEVEKFHADTNRPMEVQWNAALAAVRSGVLDSDLDRKKAEENLPFITVELVRQAAVAQNALPTVTAMAA